MAWKSCFEEYRVQSELGVEQRHVAKHGHKLIDANMSLAEMLVAVGQRIRTAVAAECPAGSDL